MKRKALIAVAVLIIAGLGYWGYTRFLAAQPDIIKATGTIEATTVNVTARLSGTLETITVQEGENVSAGQLIAQLSRSDLVAQAERDALGVAAAEAKLDDLLDGARQQEIEAAAAQVSYKEAALQKAQQDLARAESLSQAGALSQEELEQARLKLQQIETELKVAKAQLNLLQAGNRPATIEAAQAEVERSRAVLQASQAMLDDLKLISPLSGTVVSRNYEPGEYVTAGAALVTIADLSSMWIKVYVPTVDLPRIYLGQPVAVTVSGSNQTFAGTVSHIATQGEFTPKTIQTEKERTNVVYAVKILLDEPDNILKPGMPADVTFLKE
ncbi:MAG TPA: efflux RND transporter periplasmic adaptor subunit [Syntrophomonadaceae bacterium]|nr:efflux RND transporter periplasmic adaptor subunit [Syntrophomonadaceae bacterium]